MERVLITGANRGIGLALTAQFLNEGCEVIATAREPVEAEALNALADLSEQNPSAKLRVLPLHVTRGKSIKAMVASLDGAPIDVLINNAGVFGGDAQSADSMDYDAWVEAFAVNTMAPFRITTALRANLKAANTPRVVTVSSEMGSLASETAGHYAYRSSKAAVNKVMRGLATEFADDGIIVCPIHPGWVQTDMGGENAEITPAASAAGICKLVQSLTMAQSGQFLAWDGSALSY